MKRILLAPLLVSLSLLNLGFIGKPKLEVLYCDEEKYMNASPTVMWEYWPWIFDKKSGVVDCVLVPIKNSECPAMLALGSKSADTYSKENDSLFLEFVAETLSKLIDRNNF